MCCYRTPFNSYADAALLRLGQELYLCGYNMLIGQLVQAASVEEKLANIFTDFSLLLSSSLFFRSLLFTHFGETQEAEIWFTLIFGITRRNM